MQYFLENTPMIDSELNARFERREKAVNQLSQPEEILNSFIHLNDNDAMINMSILTLTRSNDADGIKRILSLLDNHFDIESRCFKENLTFLMLAAGMGHAETVKCFLKYHAYVNAVDVNKQTALHYAIIGKNLEVVNLLITDGAHLDVMDDEGNTPLMDAVLIGSVTMAQKLIQNTADMNYGKGGMGGLLDYAQKSGNPEMYEYIKSEVCCRMSRRYVQGTFKQFIEKMSNNPNAVKQLAITGSLTTACREISYDYQKELYRVVRQNISPEYRKELENIIRAGRE